MIYVMLLVMPSLVGVTRPVYAFICSRESFSQRLVGRPVVLNGHIKSRDTIFRVELEMLCKQVSCGEPETPAFVTLITHRPHMFGGIDGAAVFFSNQLCPGRLGSQQRTEKENKMQHAYYSAV